jgi:hypothetical protein
MLELVNINYSSIILIISIFVVWIILIKIFDLDDKNKIN